MVGGTGLWSDLPAQPSTKGGREVYRASDKPLLSPANAVPSVAGGGPVVSRHHASRVCSPSTATPRSTKSNANDVL